MSRVCRVNRFGVMGGAIGVVFAACGVALGQGNSPTRLRYVDVDAPASGNGQAWNTAYDTLLEALDDAANNPSYTYQIYVVGDSSSPDVYVPYSTGTSADTFDLPDHVKVLGGYAGYGASNPNLNDPSTYISILDGQLDSNDPPTLAYHVVRQVGTVNGVLDGALDGFTIRNGGADGTSPDDSGGGVYLEHSVLHVRRCIFTGNTGRHGGGAYSTNDLADDSAIKPMFIRCLFDNNSVSNVASGGDPSGGGAHVDHGQVRFFNCTFTDNTAVDAGCKGGALYLDHAFMDDDWPPALIVNCLFHDNTATGTTSNKGHGGAVYSAHKGCEIRDCTIAFNTADGNGGGVHIAQNTQMDLYNTIAYFNEDQSSTSTPTKTAQIYEATGTTVVIDYCDVEAWSNPPNNNINNDLEFVNQTGSPRNLRIQSDSPCKDTGSNSLLPADEADLDGDTNTTEAIPRDGYDNGRIYNTTVDMGSHENQGTDSIGSQLGSPAARAQMFLAEVACGDQRADLNGDRSIDSLDLELALRKIFGSR